ncbi:cysteine-rich motor neuron 1 protein-like isoform X2 [Glandiceps talaboti]
MATVRRHGFIVLLMMALGLTSVVSHSYSCSQPCDMSACPPTTDCKGGLVDDICRCCKTCARQVNESCGGIDDIFGICDEELFCSVQPPAFGEPITGNEDGTCQQKPDHMKPCDGRYTGCNIINMECLCETTVKACFNPYDYADKKQCRRALSQLGEEIFDCSKARCEPVFVTNCPEDSKAVEGFTLPGDCCPRPPQCICDPSTCIEIMCAEGYEKRLLNEGTGQPGSCCDVSECSKKDSLIDCSRAVCPDLRPILCPVDSKKVSGGISKDGCCLLPDRCECVTGKCQPLVCEPGFEARRIARGTGQPGSCCDVYECVNKTTSEWCLFEEQIYEDGATWLSDSCSYCECRGGVSHCLRQPDCVLKDITTPAVSPLCLGESKFYSHGETWNRDECTTCRCNYGEVQCTATSCAVSCFNPTKIPGRCCPYCEESTFITFPPPTCPPFICTLHCQHGYQIDTTGCPLCSCKDSVCEGLQNCDKDCPYGYRTDDNGCEICKCKNLKKCPSIETCSKHCTYGYQRNKHGCDKCKCEKCPVFQCDKVCTYGFVTNDNGCKLCKCKAGPTPPVAIIPSGSCNTEDGQYHDNGESWHDGCRNCFCHNGQEMCQLISCPIPICINPEIRSGECCPTCPDVESSGQFEAGVKVCHSSDGEYYVEGETWNIDGCTQCVCYDGHVLCSPMVCPPVPCDNPVLDSCCPVCPTEVTPSDLLPVSCISIDGAEHHHRDTWKEDDCTSCVCSHGQIKCYSHVCPLVQCKTPVLKKGQCCPTCLDTARQKYCEYENQIYTDGERWNVSACIQCHCQDGVSVCPPLECPFIDCEETVVLHGECCPKCVGETTTNLHVKTSTTSKASNTHSTTTELISTSRLMSRIRHTNQPIEKTAYNEELFTTEEPASTTKSEQAGPTNEHQEGISILAVALPVIFIVLLLSLVILVVVCLRRRNARKSSEWHKSAKPTIITTSCKPKNLDIKNSNSIYNHGAATKGCNIYNISKLNTDYQSTNRYSNGRFSGMFSMGKNKLGPGEQV